MELDESLYSRIKNRARPPRLSRSLSDSGPEEPRDADGESDIAATPRGVSCDSLIVPETPSPVFQRYKNKREREVISNQGDDSDSKRSRAAKPNFDRFVSPFKPADIRNKEKKEAFEKLRLAREKRLTKIESDSDPENEGVTCGSPNGYKYAHFGTGYLGWPSDSESDSDEDDNVPLRRVLKDRKPHCAETGERSNVTNVKSQGAIPKKAMIFKKMNEEAGPSHLKATSAPDLELSLSADSCIKTEPTQARSSRVDCRPTEFVSPDGPSHKSAITGAIADCLIDCKKQEEEKSLKTEVKPAQRRRNLFCSKKDIKGKKRPSLFDNCNNQAKNNDQMPKPQNVQPEPESRPSCRFASFGFRPASLLLNDSVNNHTNTPTSLNNTSLNDSVLLMSPVIGKPGNSRGTNGAESSNQPKHLKVNNDEQSLRKNGSYTNHLSFNIPRPEHKSPDGAKPSSSSQNNTNVIETVDLTQPDSPTFCSPVSYTPHMNGMQGACRFQTPTHGRHGDSRGHNSMLNMPGPPRPSSPDVIPLSVYNMAALRRPEYDLSVSPQHAQHLRNRTSGRRHNRLLNPRLNYRAANIATGEDDSISPTTTRLMSEVSVSNHGNDADEAVTMVRQLEDDEQYARRLQEEMDKEFAMSLHQADAGFEQMDHAGAFGAAEEAVPPCPPVLSPSFLQYCRSPVRRRGYNSNRQPINRRRRGAAAAEPEDMSSYEDLVVDGPSYEQGSRRFPAGANHPLALMEAHILALLDSSPVNQRRGRRRGGGGGRFVRNLHSPIGDGNDYEELLELAESLGEVKQKGMTKNELNRLPTRKFKGSESKEDTTDCLICMCDYQEGDKLRILPCCHEFHQPCIDKWLKNMATCPICRVDVKNS